MASLSLSLPAPRRSGPSTVVRNSPKETTTEKESPPPAAAAATLRAPTYEQRCAMAAVGSSTAGNRKPFVPRRLADFDDGGAFPEIHVAQYPRHMGNPHKQKAAASQGAAATQTQALVQVDARGQVSYDAIVTGGTNADKQVFSRHADLKGGKPAPEDVALPTDDQVEAEAARTQAALDALIAQKTKAAKPTGSAIAHAQTGHNVQAQTQFIQYTPRTDAPGYNPAAAQRVIQMVPKQVDPMMPPKHKHIKAPRGPAEDVVPVLHAPTTKKLSKEEREAWNIPACISNWKNTRGYTIPLDKRLAADGRGLRDPHTVSEHFATLSESLYVAEQQARQEVKLRATVQKQQALQAKERREEELRALAQQARLERGGALAAVQGGSSSDDDSDLDDHHDPTQVHDATTTTTDPTGPPVAAVPLDDEDDDQVAARQRDRLREARKREREKELRLEQSLQAKKKRLEEERDVSEKIALGVPQGNGNSLAGEVDARLYNQTSGFDSGFGREDEYNAYSKPLFERQHAASSASIYRPTRGETDTTADEQYEALQAGATSKFAPQKGFAGAEGGMDVQAGPRTAPVQFEKGKPK